MTGLQVFTGKAQLIEAFGEALGGRLAHVGQIYALRGEQTPQRAAAATKEIDAMINALFALRAALSNHGDLVADALSLAEQRHDIGARHDLLQVLERFYPVAFAAGQIVDPKAGRPASRREWLVANVAAALDENGLEVDSKPTGFLCVAVRIIIEAHGERVARVDNVCANALKKIAFK